VRDVSYGEGWFQRGHWADRLAAIDADIAAMEKGAGPPSDKITRVAPEKIAALVGHATGRVTRAVAQAAHTPPKNFHRGEAVALEISVEASATAAQLHYRHLNQAEPWRIEPVEIVAVHGRTAIPADYTTRLTRSNIILRSRARRTARPSSPASALI